MLFFNQSTKVFEHATIYNLTRPSVRRGIAVQVTVFVAKIWGGVLSKMRLWPVMFDTY